MNPEDNKNSADFTKPKNSLGNSFSSALFYLAILFFIIGFNFSDVKVGNWYQQFLPVPSGGQLKDIYFIDSLLGFAVSDSTIFKTTNGGNSWNVKQNGFYIFRRIHFLNSSTGYACAGNNKLLKTINSGENWIETSLPNIFPFDMSVVSEDSIWLVNTNGLTGGVFRTTNGGANWEQQLNLGSQNPTKIYMYNARIGFASTGAGLYKTTTSGINWFNVSGNGTFFDMYFKDSLTGWKCRQLMEKTTDGGATWVNQPLPTGGNIVLNYMLKFTNINSDTIWGAGMVGTVPTGGRGFLHRTTNSGDTWGYQIPDTSIHSGQYQHIEFISKLKGWVYWSESGIHTTNGGDTTFILPVHQISSEVPKEFSLFQNYPNPFNPVTKIRYSLKHQTSKLQGQSSVKLFVYDIQGKLITELINQKQTAGTYEVDFNGSSYSSGVYFYSLIIEGKAVDTKKMALVK